MTSKIIAWSFSRLNSHDTCPFKHYMCDVCKKVKDVQGPEAREGNEVHTRLENRLLKKTPLPGISGMYEPYCKAIEEFPGELHPETKMAITQDMQPTKFTNWKGAWARFIIDVLKINNDVAYVFDWKTGKVKNDYDQLSLFAAVVFLYYPQVQVVRGNYIWLKHGEMSPTQIYLRENASQIWAKHIPRALAYAQAHKEGTWPTKVSGLCKSYCIINKLGKCPDPQVPDYVNKF